MHSEYVEYVTRDPFGLQYLCCMYRRESLISSVMTEQISAGDTRHNMYSWAFQSYYYSGNPRSTQYYVCGKIHRVVWPALINYRSDNVIFAVQYYIRGILHNEYGPASVTFSENTVYGEFYIDGVLQKSE